MQDKMPFLIKMEIYGISDFYKKHLNAKKFQILTKILIIKVLV